MEDFIGIIVLVLIALVSASGKKKKKAEKPARQRRQAEKPRETRLDQAFEKKRQPARTAASAPQPSASAPQRETDNADRSVHPHEAMQRQMAFAGEGEDPCHPEPRAPQEPSPVFAQESGQPDPRAQELLRGVIMSEILKRPCERMAERHDRRRA